jgi:hypothetical protein
MTTPSHTRFGAIALTALTALTLALTLGLGGTRYLWERPVEAPRGAGWCVLELPDDVLAAARPGLPDLRVVAGDEEIAYMLESHLRPTRGAERLLDVEIASGRETTAIVDRGPKAPPSGSIEVEVPGAEAFLKPVIVEASDDRASWREIARGSLFRTEGATMTALRFARSDRRYFRLRLDDRNGAPVRPESVVVERPVDASPARQVQVSVARAPDGTSPASPGGGRKLELSGGVSTYVVTLPSEHLPVAALELETHEPAFERRARVFERVLFRDEVSRRLVGEGTISRSASGRGSSAIALGDVSAQTLEVDVDDADSPLLSISGANAHLESKRIVFFAPDGAALSLRYGSVAASAPRYDLDAALAKGRPASLREARLGAAVYLGPPAPNIAPTTRAAAVKEALWTVRRPIQLPARGPVAYLDVDPGDSQSARILDANGLQVPYVFEQSERHLRRNVALAASEHGQTTDLTITGADASRARSLELSATAPDYFERQVVVSQETFDQRGVTGRRTLGTATWKKGPGEPFAPLRIPLSSPEGRTLLVAIDNGDNPPLTLGPAAVDIAVRRVDFAFVPSDKLTLLTGNPGAEPVRYDLAILAPVVLATPAEAATLGEAEAPPAATPAVPRWFWIAGAASGGLLVLALLRAIKPVPAEPGAGPAP